MYSGYGITFDSEGSWSSDNGTARDVISFGDFIKPNTKFCLSLHYNADNISLFVNRKEIIKFKAENENVNFPTQFCLGSISDVFSATEFREVHLNGIVYEFSVDYNSIDKSDILNIHKYLMTKNNIK